MRIIPHSRRPLHFPDLFDWAASRDICVAEHRVRWVTNRCRVSPSTARTILALAGFSVGEHANDVYHGRSTMAIAAPQSDTGGVSAPPALHPHPMSRTITDGVLGRVEGGHAKTA